LLITDYATRELNGFEFLRRRKQRCPDLKAICMTGSLVEETRHRVELKPDMVVDKPFSFDQQAARVEGLVGRAATR
jgi:CheY-like chemotaxis protein